MWFQAFAFLDPSLSATASAVLHSIACNRWASMSSVPAFKDSLFHRKFDHTHLLADMFTCKCVPRWCHFLNAEYTQWQLQGVPEQLSVIILTKWMPLWPCRSLYLWWPLGFLASFVCAPQTSPADARDLQKQQSELLYISCALSKQRVTVTSLPMQLCVSYSQETFSTHGGTSSNIPLCDRAVSVFKLASWLWIITRILQVWLLWVIVTPNQPSNQESVALSTNQNCFMFWKGSGTW